jgi:hypothetical protein
LGTKLVVRILPLLLMLTGCASGPGRWDEIRLGMDKAQILELAGNPKRTFRDSGTDVWEYEFIDEGRQIQRQIVFSSGKVSRMTAPRPRGLGPASADSMEQFERRGRSEQRQRQRGFKSIDGGPADPSQP